MVIEELSRTEEALKAWECARFPRPRYWLSKHGGVNHDSDATKQQRREYLRIRAEAMELTQEATDGVA